MERPVILASGSPRRKELLKDICPEFTVITAGIDERTFPGESPEELVRRLSLEKAEEVWNRTAAEGSNGRIVIGADTVVALEGEIMGKPAGEEDARRMLSKLSGRQHQVFTGVAILWEGGKESFSCASQVEFYPLTGEEIDDYIASGEPFGKAGAYAIQFRGKLFVKGISGDYSNIVGFPAAQVYRRLIRNGLLSPKQTGKL